MKSTRTEALQAIRTLIAYIGEDPDRAELQKTPERVIKAWEEYWGTGYTAQLPIDLFSIEDGCNYNQLLVQRGIQFSSVCAHHMAPFSGTVDIGYLPDPHKGLVGLSKLARIVDLFARRLQMQERLCGNIADFMETNVSNLGVGVVIRATHGCMTTRGVMQPHTTTVTSALRGALLDEGSARAEFLSLCHKD